MGFASFNLHRHTIARDLTVGMIVTIGVVFAIAGSVNYVYSVDRDTTALYDKANEIMDNLASVLVTPMWNLNNEELKKIVDVYRHSGIVLDIKLIDEEGESMVPTLDLAETPFLEMTRVINYEKKAIGRVTVAFSDANIIEKQREIAIYSVTIFVVLTLALILSTTLLLRRFLTAPFLQLKRGLDIISEGDYTHELPAAVQEDVNDITQKANAMAREIAKREAVLEENREKLEILNQAILDIFSCSDTNSLIRTTMLLTHKVCGVDHGWFLAKADSPPGDAGTNDPSHHDPSNSSPMPLICVQGHTFEATTRDVETHISQNDASNSFRFPIKSRHRKVGEMTLTFENKPDATVTSLLKSLMSLVNLAMVRQSFIRETAFISAELQVAETVQRSMLPDENELPTNALVSYHYEPVLRVGGDWFSVIESQDEDSLYIILGDVTGHGLAQGLVTTAVAGAISVVESMIKQGDSTHVSHPSQIVTQLNNVIAAIAGKSNLRMTCVAARIDFRQMQIHVCNAGHTFPLMLSSASEESKTRGRANSPERARVRSLAQNQQHMLGEDSPAAAEHTYSDASYDFHEDDVLVFYTDGLTEAVDQTGRAFNRAFLRHFNHAEAKRSVVKVRDDLIELFRTHTEGTPVQDDICVLVVSKRPDEAKVAPDAA